MVWVLVGKNTRGSPNRGLRANFPDDYSERVHRRIGIRGFIARCRLVAEPHAHYSDEPVFSVRTQVS